MKYRGQGVFQIEEKGRKISGPSLAELEDSYEMELDGNEVRVDGGPSDAPLHPLFDTAAPAKTAPAPAAREHSTTSKKKKQH